MHFDNLLLGWSCLAIAVVLVGCFAPRRNATFSQDAIERKNKYPESVLESLTANTRTAIEAFTTKVPTPNALPIGNNKSLQKVYLDWYRRGYAFVFVTGIEHVRDQITRLEQPEEEKIKVIGWFDGNLAGGLASRIEGVRSAVDKIRPK